MKLILEIHHSKKVYQIWPSLYYENLEDAVMQLSLTAKLYKQMMHELSSQNIYTYDFKSVYRLIPS